MAAQLTPATTMLDTLSRPSGACAWAARRWATPLGTGLVPGSSRMVRIGAAHRVGVQPRQRVALQALSNPKRVHTVTTVTEKGNTITSSAHAADVVPVCVCMPRLLCNVRMIPSERLPRFNNRLTVCAPQTPAAAAGSENYAADATGFGRRAPGAR